MIPKLLFCLFSAATLAAAAVTYTVTNTNTFNSVCYTGPQMASNGNVVCRNLVYNPSTGVTSTIAPLTGVTLNGYDYTNASGEIAAAIIGASSTYAEIINGSSVTTLPVPAGATSVQVYGLDNLGDIVGQVVSAAGTTGIVWNSSLAYSLIAPDDLQAIAISPNGAVAYETQQAAAYLYSIPTGVSTPTASLSSLILQLSGGPAIPLITSVNNSGAVLGYYGYSQLAPFEATASTLTKLCSSPSNCPGSNISTGAILFGINSAGQAVGTGGIPAGYPDAFLYSSGAFQDLNSLLSTNLNTLLGGSGWYLDQATAINDNGQILARAANGLTDANVLLTPVTTSTPEPATSVLLLLGSAALYLTSSRYRKH